jgi:hypothetical protein
VAYDTPALSPPAFPAFVYLKFVQGSVPCPPPPLVHFQSSCPFCCVLIFYLFIFLVGSQSAQGAMLVYPRGGWVNTT